MAKDGDFVRDGDAEAAEAEVWRGGQEVAKIVDQEGKVNGVEAARDEGGVVQQGRKGMRDGIADYAEDFGLAVQLVGAIEMLEVVKGDLAWRGGGGEGRIGQGAALAEGEDAGRESYFAHGDGDAVGRTRGKFEEAHRVREGMGGRGDFCG